VPGDIARKEQKKELVQVSPVSVGHAVTRKRKTLLCQNYNFWTSFICLQLLKICNGDKQIVKATKNYGYFNRYGCSLVCTGTKRDYQCNRYLLL